MRCKRETLGFSKEYLNECFEYADGKIYWKNRPREHFKTDRYYKYFNAKFAGQQAFTSVNGTHGYCQGGLDGSSLLRGYVIYTMFHGEPDRSIKRIDGNKTNDDINNLYLSKQNG